MNESLLNRILKDHKRRTRSLALILCLSMIVSLGTFAGFHQTAIAKVYTREVLDCPYAREGAEPVAHVHNDDCYEGETLVCTLPEREAHTHTDECFTEQRVLVCTLEENPGHQHSEECYDENGELICQIPEGEGAHTHTEECYTIERVLSCERAELNVHVHDAGCFHTEEISVDEPEETVAPEQAVNTIPEMPVSDPDADLETADDWNREIENLELSGNWARDLVLVAATQQGRGESPNNFEAVLNDAGDAWVRHGYTRYGAWYGYPYAEWDAMFVSFCLRYAGIPVENVPNNPTAAFMAESFSMGGLFAGRDYVPAVGDLIFFDTVDDEITNIDHMGIVYYVDEENGTINTVEGDRTDAVETFGYRMDDEQIIGYGILPQNPNYIPAEGELEEEIENEFDGFIFMTTDEEDPKEAETAEETPAADDATAPAVSMPAQSWERTAGGIKVTVDAPEGAFPENTKIAVTPVNGNSLKDTVSDAVSGEVLEVQAVDITFFDADGHEIEPAVPIRVSMTPAETEHAEEKANVVHIDLEQQTAEVITQAEGTETDNSEVVFDANAFTIYAIVYTVHFEYEVDGETYTSASMPGAEYTSLAEVIRGLGIVSEEEVDTFVSKISTVASTDESVAVVENTEDKGLCVRVLRDGDAQIVITMQDGAQFRVDVVADGETAAGNETVTVSTVGDLYLPAEAKLEAKVLPEEQSESAIAAVEAAAGSVESNAVAANAYQVFDISLENVEADQYDGFQVEVKLPENVVGRDFRLFHIHDGKTTEIKLNTLSRPADNTGLEVVSGFSFETEDFSEFVLKYTVDFTYEGRTWSFPGRGSYRLVDVLAMLGIEGKVDEAILTLVLGEDHAGALYLTQSDGEYFINSDIPFVDTYELRVQIGEKVYIITVTDGIEQSTNDLNKLITDVEITSSETGESIITEDGKLIVKSGSSYDFAFTFSESIADDEHDGYQMLNAESLYYILPDGVNLPEGAPGVFAITIGNRVIPGNTYEVVRGENGQLKLKIDFNKNHRNFRFLANSNNVEFTLRFTGTISDEAEVLGFDSYDHLQYEVEHQNKHNASVKKTGYYSESDKKMHYKVILHSEDGDSNNVNVIDTLSGSALSNAQITGVYVSDQNGTRTGSDVSYTPNNSENGFDISVAKVAENQYVTIEYTADVNFDAIQNNGKATFSETGNTVSINVPGDDDTTDNTDTHEEPGIVFSTISKVSTSTSDIVDEAGNPWADDSTGQKYRIVTWKVTANTEGLVSLKDSDITDKLLNGNETDYTGNGISVVKITNGQRSEPEEVSWADVGVTDKNNTAQWSYHCADEGNVAYEITYQTRVKVPEGTNELEVNNVAKSKYDEDTGKVKIQPDIKIEPDKEVPIVSKTATSVTTATTTWKIAVEIPAGWTGPLVITDTLPTKGGYYDTVNSILVDGYTEGTDYKIEIIKAKKQISWDPAIFEEVGDEKAIISFLYDIPASASNRTINIIVVTNNNQEWVNKAAESDETAWLNDHENTAQGSDGVNPYGEPDKDKVQPKPENIVKTAVDGGSSEFHYYMGYQDAYNNPVYADDTYPIYPFDVKVEGVTSEPVVINEIFDTDLFEIYTGDWGHDHNNSYTDRLKIYYDDNSYWISNDSGKYAAVTETSTGATVTLTDLPRTEGNAFYSFYRVRLYLVVKQDKLDEFKEFVIRNGDPYVDVNGNATGKKYTFTNVAAWNELSDDAPYTYTIDKLFNKSGTDNDDGTYSYTITLNPDKLKINGGVNYDMMDVFSGAKVTASTLNITAMNADGNPVPYKVYDSDSAAAEDPEFEGIIVIYDKDNDTVLTVEIPDETSVVMTYTADSTRDVTINTETGKAVETVTNTATALDYSYTVTFTHEYEFINKNKTANDDGTITFTIDFNKDKLKLKGGENITLTDTYTGNLTIDNNSFSVTVCDPDDETGTKAAAILSSKQLNENVYTFTIPDETHVTITYQGSANLQIDANGNVSAVYSNTAEAENVPVTVDGEVDSYILQKTADALITSVDPDDPDAADLIGFIPFTIEFNPLRQTLNGGNDIELKDRFSGLLVEYSTIETYVNGVLTKDIDYDYSGYVGTFIIPDATHITIKYMARPDFSQGAPVEWSNTVEAHGYKDSQSGTEDQSSAGEGSGDLGNEVFLYKYEAGHMNHPINNVTFKLFKDDGKGNMEPVLNINPNSGDYLKQITFTTTDDPEKGPGYVLVKLDQEQGYDLGLDEDWIYFLVEDPESTPEGFYNNTTAYNFVIHPDMIKNNNDEWVANKPYLKPDYMTGTTIYVFGKDDIVKVANDKITTDVTVQKYWVNADGSWDWPADISEVVVKLQQKIGNDGEWKDISIENNNIPSYYWDDENNVLQAGEDGTVWSDTIKLTSSSSKGTWINLDLDDGKEEPTTYYYRVVEVSVNGEAVEDGKVIVNGMTYDVNGGVVTNGKTSITNSAYTDVKATKTWEIPTNSITFDIPEGAVVAHNYLNDGKVTVSKDDLMVKVRLHRYHYAGGDKMSTYDFTDEETDYLADLTSSVNWTKTWENLPTARFDDEGNEVDFVYEVEEVMVTVPTEIMKDSTGGFVDIKDIFTASSSKSGNNITITNKLKNDENYYLTVTKNWQDAAGNATVGEPVEIQLVRGTEKTTTIAPEQATITVVDGYNSYNPGVYISNSDYHVGDKVQLTFSTTAWFNGYNISGGEVDDSNTSIVKDNGTAQQTIVFEITSGTVIIGLKDGGINNNTIYTFQLITSGAGSSSSDSSTEIMKPVDESDYSKGFVVDPSGAYCFTLDADKTIYFPNLPYTSTEGSSTSTYTYTVIEKTTGSFTTTVTYSDGTSYNPAPASGGESGSNGSVTILNKTTSVEKSGPATLKLHKEDGQSRAMAGVMFTLTDSASAAVVSGTTDANGNLELTIPETALGKHNGSGDTTTAKTFTLTETVPTGYIEVGPWTVTVTANGVESSTADDGTTIITHNWLVTSVGDLAGSEGVYTIVNTPDEGSLKLSKVVTVNKAATTTTVADGDYTFTVTGPKPKTDLVARVTITVKNGVATQYKLGDNENYTDLPEDKFVVLSGLKTGTYTITETTPTNGTAISKINGIETTDYSTEVTVVAGDTTAAQASAEFTNNIDLGSLTITKIIQTNGKLDSSKTGTFSYAVYKAADVDESGSPKENVTAAATGQIVVGSDGTNPVTVSDLPYGTYYVYELGQDGTPIVSGESGALAVINGLAYTVIGSGTRVTVGAAAAGTESGDGTGAPAGNEVMLINELTDFEFTKIWKDALQNNADWPDNLEISVTVSRMIGSSEAAETVGTYTLKKTASGFTITKQPDQATTPDLSEKTDTKERNYTFRIQNLPKTGSIGDATGEYTYFVTEAALSGYHTSYSSPSPNGSTPSQYAFHEGTIINTPVGGYELPETGGIGTTLFTALGGLMTVTAGAILTMKSYRRRKQNA